tara:strand:- start:241 stop:948 length:708 start_codon:yes stop_codon:yes gene_type:complete
MSNLTDFFPSTGGSSNITDPKLLPRIAVGPVSDTRWMKISTTALVTDGYTTFWNAFTAASLSESMSLITLSTTTFNTYETVLDISSSTNGGYLNYVLGSYIQAGQTETYKITVDGVATEIVRAPPTGASYQSSILGWVSPGKGSVSQTQAGGPGAMGEQSAYTSTYALESTAVLNNNVSNGFFYSKNNVYTLPNTPWAYPSLKFKETLKIEIKRSGIYSSANDVYNYAAVRHTMI